MQASKELWRLTLILSHRDKENFEDGHTDWYIKWMDILNERKVDEKGKKMYMHKRLINVHRSRKTNLSWFFTWYDNREMQKPHTTNAKDIHFFRSKKQTEKPQLVVRSKINDIYR